MLSKYTFSYASTETNSRMYNEQFHEGSAIFHKKSYLQWICTEPSSIFSATSRILAVQHVVCFATAAQCSNSDVTCTVSWQINKLIDWLIDTPRLTTATISYESILGFSLTVSQVSTLCTPHVRCPLYAKRNILINGFYSSYHLLGLYVGIYKVCAQKLERLTGINDVSETFNSHVSHHHHHHHIRLLTSLVKTQERT